MAFARIEPLGYEAEMWGHAQTASLIAETNRDAKTRPTPYLLSEFLPQLVTEESAEEIPEENTDERAKRVGGRLFDDLAALVV